MGIVNLKKNAILRCIGPCLDSERKKKFDICVLFCFVFECLKKQNCDRKSSIEIAKRP